MRNPRILLAILLAGASLPLSAQQPPLPDSPLPMKVSRIEAAESAMNREDWRTAEPTLRTLVQENPSDTRAWFDLGYVMHAQKKYGEAIIAYRSAISATPSCFECNLNLGLLLANNNDPDAERYLDAATRLKPRATGDAAQKSLAQAWAALGQLRDAQGAKNAVDAWREATTRAPQETEYCFGLSAALEHAGQKQEAERELQRATAMSPQSYNALAAQANFYLHEKRWPEAADVLRKMIALDASNENAHLELAQVLLSQGDDRAAAGEVSQVLARHADSADALRLHAYLEERGKQWSAAEADYRKLLAAAPQDAELHAGLGAALLGQLHYVEAQKQFELSVHLQPSLAEAWGQLAMAAYGAKNYLHAIQALDQRKKLLPEPPSSLYFRAICYDSLHQYKLAAENYRAFLAASKGQASDDEWKARHRLLAIDPQASRQK